MDKRKIRSHKDKGEDNKDENEDADDMQKIEGLDDDDKMSNKERIESLEKDYKNPIKDPKVLKNLRAPEEEKEEEKIEENPNHKYLDFEYFYDQEERAAKTTKLFYTKEEEGYIVKEDDKSKFSLNY